MPPIRLEGSFVMMAFRQALFLWGLRNSDFLRSCRQGPVHSPFVAMCILWEGLFKATANELRVHRR